MKINKGMFLGVIGILLVVVVAISVYALTETQAGSDKTDINESTMNSHNEHDMNNNNEEQLENQEVPTMPGQEAFGTIQEIINILENDANTDWSKVNIPGLKEHLIDMNELTLYADAKEIELENGLEMNVSGKDRTIDAIQRMVPTHVEMTLNDVKKWDVKVKQTDDGVTLTATSEHPKEAERIKGLGFIGLMATGANHPSHHLMMAKGEMH